MKLTLTMVTNSTNHGPANEKHNKTKQNKKAFIWLPNEAISEDL